MFAYVPSTVPENKTKKSLPSWNLHPKRENDTSLLPAGDREVQRRSWGMKQAGRAGSRRQGSWAMQYSMVATRVGHRSQITMNHRSQSWILFFSLHRLQDKVQIESVALSVLQSGSLQPSLS